jgi:hypothetical protein
MQRSGFDSLRYRIFWEVVGLKRGPLSLVSTIEELLERKSSCVGLEIRDYGSRDLWRLPRGILYPQELALTSPTNCTRSIGIVRSRTQATEFSFSYRDEVKREWRKVHNEELRDLYSSPSVIRIIKSKRMKRAGNVALNEIRELYIVSINIYRILRTQQVHNKTSTDICCVRRFLYILIDTHATGCITQ